MSPTARFVLAWIAASAPLPWLGELALHDVLSAVHARTYLGYWWPVVPYYAAIATATAWLQVRVLARHRRPVDGWIRASLIGHVAAGLVFLSITSQWDQFRGQFGAVRMPEWFMGLYYGKLALTALSWTVCAAVPEAVALSGRRWTSAGCLWIAGRVGIVLGLLGITLSFGLFRLGPVNHFPFYSFVARACALAAWQIASAAGTAWLLEKLAFRGEIQRGT